MQYLASPSAPVRQAVTPTEIWIEELQNLLRVCNTITSAQLPEIWNTIAPLNKDQDQALMEAA